jgi:hypothetical protein
VRDSQARHYTAADRCEVVQYIRLPN